MISSARKGITIKAKHAAIEFKGHKINIIDTPGHADFGGEVERTLNMADGCLLIVDAQEGPMPQTKFVLRKALAVGLKPILVINKIDKKFADSAKALDKVNDLFLELATDETQLDFPVFYAVGREGKAFPELPSGDIGEADGTIEPLLDAVIEHVPAPIGDDSGDFQMLITTLDFDSHIGRLLVGRINRGQIKLKDNVVVIENEEPGARRVKGQVKKFID